MNKWRMKSSVAKADNFVLGFAFVRLGEGEGCDLLRPGEFQSVAYLTAKTRHKIKF